jgi:hypothetical protein
MIVTVSQNAEDPLIDSDDLIGSVLRMRIFIINIATLQVP